MRKPRVETPLQRLRRARTLNQQQLANLVGISQQDISEIELGKVRPSIDIQARIAAILGAGRDELFPVAVTRTDEALSA